MTIGINGMAHVILTVSRFEVAREFYRKLLLEFGMKPVLGPWANGRWVNLFTGAVIAVQVMLSIILTASVLYPISAKTTIPCDPGRRHVALVCHGGRLPVVAPGRGERIRRRPPPRELADAAAA